MFRSNEPLTNTQLQRYAPSIFATTHHRSSRYAQIPTIEVIDDLRSAGFLPFAVGQANSRTPDKREIASHLVRLRNVSSALQEDSHMEILLRNSHDGASQYKMAMGWFRFVCSNGLVVSDGPTSSVSIRHTGNAKREVVSAAQFLLSQQGEQVKTLNAMRHLQLTSGEQEVFAAAALVARFGDEPAPITPDAILHSRRSADTPADMWTVLNRVQENLVRGGIRYQHPPKVNERRGRRDQTRAVTAIKANTQLNQALWQLAAGMAQLKGADAGVNR